MYYANTQPHRGLAAYVNNSLPRSSTELFVTSRMVQRPTAVAADDRTHLHTTLRVQLEETVRASQVCKALGIRRCVGTSSPPPR